MSYLDRKNLLVANLIDRTVKESNGKKIQYCNLDKNVATLYMKFKTQDENGTNKEIEVSESSDYAVTLRILKPGYEVKEIIGVPSTYLNEECLIYKFVLTSDYTNQLKDYICTTIVKHDNQELILNKFVYSVYADETNKTNAEIITDPAHNVLLELIERVENLGTGGTGEGGSAKAKYVKVEDVDNNFISDNVEGALKELINKDVVKTKLENGKLYLLDKNGNKLDEGTELNIGETVEPELVDMPRVFFYGNALPTTKDDVLLTMDYISNTDKFSSYIKLKCQGTSSMTYDKKNFTINMYSDEARTIKLKKDFKGWGAQSKFCLKANWVDTTHTRNISGARIAYDMVQSRPDSAFKQQLLTAPRGGAVDGFPIKLYFNGEFFGIYTWNIPKDGWMFNMDKSNPNHIVLCAERNTDGNSGLINSCQFRQLWNGVDGGDWSYEFGTPSDTVKNSLNRCIGFVMNATDQEFHDNISEYFDLYSLLDYYCFSYLTCHLDGLAKNMLMVTYDGTIWGACLYDMDSIYGVNWNGNSYVATNYQCPEQYQEQFSRLWVRIEQCFATELYARYLELRQGALSLSNIVKHVEEIYDVIPDRVFADEKAKWTNLPQVSTNTMTRFRNYMRDRAVYVDTQMLEIGTKVPCTGIVISNDSLSFTTTDTQTLTATLTPTDTTDEVVWSVNPTGFVTVENGVVTPIKNGTCVVTATCGSQSATCNVTVSGITITETEDVIQTTYTNGYIARGINHLSVGFNYGDLKSSTVDISTDFINHTPGNYYVVQQPSTTYGCGIIAYDDNKNYLATCVADGQRWVYQPNSSYAVDLKDTNITIDNIPGDVAYIRMCFNTVDSSSIIIKAYSGGTVGENTKTETFLSDITWSSNADNGIYNNSSQGTIGEEKGAGNGDAYLSGQIPCGKKKYVLSNINGATFIYKEMYVYTSDGTFLGGNYKGGKYDTTTAVDSSGGDVTIDLRATTDEVAYMRITVYPNNVATNNDPANQLKLTVFN